MKIILLTIVYATNIINIQWEVIFLAYVLKKYKYDVNIMFFKLQTFFKQKVNA